MAFYRWRPRASDHHPDGAGIARAGSLGVLGNTSPRAPRVTGSPECAHPAGAQRRSERSQRSTMMAARVSCGKPNPDLLGA